MSAKRTPVSTAGGKAYELIRTAILQGDFLPGRRLKEDELTTLCEVSRTPVREALRRLALEGLVIVTPNAGAQVSSISSQELDEVYALRAMIESHAARRAAELIDTSSLARLRVLAAQMERAAADAGANLSVEFTPANAEFHRIILEAAMSPRLSAMAALVIEVPLTVRTLARYSRKDLARSMGHHRELIDALEARDGEWAASVMKSHILAAYQTLARLQPEEARKSA
jgi:DNA-binding GntR family transcriptional regulator